ncbi:HEAT repeat domain-containing protein [Streptosporangium sp. NBC_01755]|uniref:HEAT repeat domain-containing protein n=1 Tax=unclassified Streptosporangium TaxID=2632669 RepID=UPI002DD9904C|nr:MULTISPECIES: HEAT repeat domain-containing protein [unclassified Streptosporangium]WSA27932.1 HEAT repeat domain-containing protein [Streptosporangium sp. NBC_01810]WSD00597.1 HEAT repeat domain-containing protein [Streptosporangium sp. NBC_01755]
MDSIHRLVLAGARGGRDPLEDLARALFIAVSNDELAELTLGLLTAAGPKIWLELDSVLRPWMYGYQDPRITLAQAVREMSNPLAVALTACSRDGRERAKAVKHPAMRTDVRLFPVLAIRTADWANAVQRQALRALSEVVSRADAAALLTLVPVVVRLDDRRRGQPATEMIRAALLRADGDTLGTVRRCEDLRGRRFVFEVSLEARRMDQRQLAEAALHESDIISRTRCAEALAAEAVEQNRPELVEELLDSSSARVRVEALTALVRLGRTESGPRFLCDGASMMRLTAQWAVQRAGGDPAELYRRYLAAPSGQGLRGLLAGLGDCGTRADAGLALPFLSDPRPRVRAEAVRTLRRLGATVDIADLLEDPAPVVVRNVVNSLRASGPAVRIEQLWALLGPDKPRHVRQAAHRLLADRDAWSRIRADLLLLGDLDPVLSACARTDLGSWCSRDSTRVYRGCPDEIRSELEDMLARSESIVGVENARLLRWLIRTSR